MKRLILPLLFLTGCASSGPVYDSRTVTGPSAKIHAGNRWSLAAVYGIGGEASCTVQEIDGLPTTRPAETKKIAVGKHTLGVQAISGNGFAVGYLQLDAKAGREYAVRAKEHGIGYIVMIVDTTNEGNEIELQRIKLLKSGENRRQSVPVFIPIPAG